MHPRERIRKEKWTNLAQKMKPMNPCLSHRRRRHTAGAPLSHDSSTSTLIDTVNPPDVPRLADKSTEAGGGGFIATEYPHVSSYYHNISRLPSSLWTLRCRQQHLTSPSPFLRLAHISPPHTWKTGDKPETRPWKISCTPGQGNFRRLPIPGPPDTLPEIDPPIL